MHILTDDEDDPMKFRNTAAHPLKFELDGEWFTAVAGGEVTPEIPRRIAACLPKGLPVEPLEPIVQPLPPDAPAAAVRVERAAKSGGCESCARLGYRPCSVACFVRAGYKAGEFDSYVANCEKREEESKSSDDEARRKPEPPAAVAADPPSAPTPVPESTEAPPPAQGDLLADAAPAAASTPDKGSKSGKRPPVMS